MKKALSLVSIAGLLVLASCSGDSSSAPAMPTPTTDTWAISSLTVDDDNPLVGVTVGVTAVVTKNGEPAPDGTDVTFSSSGGVLGSGGTQVHASTADGSATVAFTATTSGAYTIQAQVSSVTKSVSVTYRDPDVTEDLEIYSVVPDQGSLDGGEVVVLNGKGVIPPVEVGFTVGTTSYPAEVLEIGDDGMSVSVRTPEITGVDPAQEYSASITISVGVGTANEQQQTLPGAFRYLPTSGDPEIYSLFPNEGGWDGGDQVTIYGTSFAGPIRVTFNTPLGTFNVQETALASDGSQITLTTPSIAATDPGVDYLASVSVYNEYNTDREKVVTKPDAFVFKSTTASYDDLALYSVVPEAGPPAGGDSVAILGQGIIEPVSVTFNISGVQRTAQVASVDPNGSNAVVQTPALPDSLDPSIEHLADITVIRGQGTDYEQTVTLTGGFRYVPTGGAPEIYSVFPDEGSWEGGESVTVYGANFVEPVRVEFTTSVGTVDAQETSLSADGSQIALITPPIATSDPGLDYSASVTVYSEYGTDRERQVTKADAYLFLSTVAHYPDLALYSVVPEAGPATGGESVTIVGEGIIEPLSVTFDISSVQRTVTVLSVNQAGTNAVVQTPALPDSLDPSIEHLVDVTVIRGQGTNYEQTVTLTDGFRYVPTGGPPEIYSVFPDEGSWEGGESVTVYGANFVEPVRVEFTTSLGTVDVDETTVSSDGSQIALITPSIAASDPDADQMASITVYSEYGTDRERSVTKQEAYLFLSTTAHYADLKVLSIIPDAGSPEGGESVTISGQGMHEPMSVTFTVSGIQRNAEILSVDPGGVNVVVQTPALPDSLDPAVEYIADVTVVRGEGEIWQQNVTVQNAFRYLPATGDPEIYSLFPDEGDWDGGDQVTVYGANFVAPIRVTFTTGLGTVDAQETNLSTDGSQIALTTPPIAASDPGTDQVASVTVYSEYNTDREKVVTKSNAFVFLTGVPTPVITGVSPTSGPMEGGTEVTIFGTGFATPIQVMFGTREAEVVTVDDTEILAISPDYTPTGATPPVTVDITVTNLDYGLSDTLAGAFTYGESMFITSNSPSEGDARGGDVVTIYGSGFRDPLTVTWVGGGGAGVAQQVTSVSGNQIVINTTGLDPLPCDDQEGPFRVTQVDSGVSAEGGSWTYRGESPRIGSVQPASAAYPEGGPAPSITINGSRFRDPVRVTFGESAPSLESPVDENTIETDLPDWRLFMELESIECTGDQSFSGCRETGTPVDVTVVNVNSGCEDTLEDGFMYVPEVTECREIAAVASASFHDFGDVAVSDTATWDFDLQNNGTAEDLRFDWTGDVGDPFSIAPATGTLNTGGSVTITVTFAPTESGTYGDNLNITATGGACGAQETIVVQLQGTAP